MRLRNTLVAASLLALPTAAMAQPVNGLYVGAGFGYNFLQNQAITQGSPTSNLKLSTNGGWVGLASVGYGLGNGFRFELEGNYRSDDQNQNAAHAFNQTYGGMFNALYDFDFGLGYLYPYLGLGIGFEDQNISKGRTGAGVTFSGSETSAAAQLILGVSMPVSYVEGLSATAEYRLMGTFERQNYGPVELDTQINHSVLLGLRYALNVAPPPPPPAPAPVAAPMPAPARTYLVFFDWDKADLTERAKQIIGEAAANVARVQVTRIEVNGYTDTSGSPKYNQKLSVRRAENVAAELVRDGVPKNEITIQGFGDTHLLVPTGPGVREPQNRRVEIILK